MMLDSTGIGIASEMDQELTTVGRQGEQARPATHDSVCNSTQYEAATTPVRVIPGDSANPINWSKVRDFKLQSTRPFNDSM